MATIKMCTDIPQSKVLANILNLGSADMLILNNVGRSGNIDGTNCTTILKENLNPLAEVPEILPCWSLAALLDVIPIIIGNVLEKDVLRLRMDKSETDFNIWYDNLDSGMVEEGLDFIESNTVDACYEMILKLHELNLL